MAGKSTNSGQFKKGQAKIPGSGRVAGGANKKSTAVKEALEQAFKDSGGVEALTKFAKANPAEFYRLWAKMLPKDIQADVTSNGETLTSTVTADEAVALIRQFQRGYKTEQEGGK